MQLTTVPPQLLTATDAARAEAQEEKQEAEYARCASNEISSDATAQTFGALSSKATLATSLVSTFLRSAASGRK